jgi:hypothetical protein
VKAKGWGVDFGPSGVSTLGLFLVFVRKLRVGVAEKVQALGASA